MNDNNDENELTPIIDRRKSIYKRGNARNPQHYEEWASPGP